MSSGQDKADGKQSGVVYWTDAQQSTLMQRDGAKGYASGFFVSGVVGCVATYFILTLGNPIGIAKRLPRECAGPCVALLTCSERTRPQSREYQLCLNFYGANFTNGWFGDPRNHLQSSALVYDLQNYSSIVDLRCSSNFRGYFHLIWNCLVPFAPVFSHRFSSDVAWLSEPQVQHIIDELQLLPEQSKIFLAPHREKIKAVSGRSLQRALPPSTRRYFQMPSCVRCIRSIVQDTLNLALTNGRCINRTLLYTWRDPKKGRTQPGHEELLSWLERAFPLLDVKIFYGNESLREAVQLFHSAKVVVGPHGAAFANVVFCQNDTFVLEITRERKEGKMWRTNRKVPLASGAQVEVYTLQLNNVIEDIRKLNFSATVKKSTPLPFRRADMLHTLSSIARFMSNCWET